LDDPKAAWGSEEEAEKYSQIAWRAARCGSSRAREKEFHEFQLK